MKTSKRLISALLSIIIVLSMFTIIPFTASATGEENEIPEESAGTVTVKALYKSQKIEWEVDGSHTVSEYTVSYGSGTVSNIKKYEYDGKTYFYALDETNDLRTYTVTTTDGATTIGTKSATHYPCLDELVQNAAYSSLFDTDFNTDASGIGRVFNTTSGAYTITSSNETDSTKAKLYQQLHSLDAGSVVMGYTNRTSFGDAAQNKLQRLFESTNSSTSTDAQTHFHFGPTGNNMLRVAAGNTSRLFTSTGIAMNNVGVANIANNLVVSAKKINTRGSLIASANGLNTNGWLNNGANGHFLETGEIYDIGKSYTAGTIHYFIISEETYDDNTPAGTANATGPFDNRALQARNLSSYTVDEVKFAKDIEYNNLEISEFTAKALYKSHKLEWTANKPARPMFLKDNANIAVNASYNKVNDKYYYTALLSVANGTAAGANYTLKAMSGVGDKSSAIEHATGLEALKNNALIAVNYGTDGKYFAGNETVNILDTLYDSDKKEVILQKMKAFSQNGAVIVAMSVEDINRAQYVLDTSNGTQGSFFMGVKTPVTVSGTTQHGNTSTWTQNVSYYTFTTTGSTNVQWGINNTGSAAMIPTNNNPVCYSLIDYKDGNNDRIGYSINGGDVGYFTNAGYRLFGSGTQQLFLGGKVNGTDCFTGAVYYAIVSEEAYTVAEIKTISNLATSEIKTNYDAKVAKLGEFNKLKTELEPEFQKGYKTSYVENEKNQEALETIKEALPNCVGNVKVLNNTLEQIAEKKATLEKLQTVYRNLTEKELCETLSEECSNLQKIEDDQLAERATASSSHTGQGPENAFKDTGMWIQEWEGSAAPGLPTAANPQWIQTDLGEVKSIGALGYVTNTNGGEVRNVIGSYEIWLSNDSTFAEGTYVVANTGTFTAVSEEQKAVFDTPYDARYIRLVAKSNALTSGSHTFVGAKQINIYEYVGAPESVKIEITTGNGDDKIEVAVEEVENAVRHKFVNEVTESELQKAALDGAFDEVFAKYNSLKYDYTVDTITRNENAEEGEANYIVSVTQEDAEYTLVANCNGEQCEAQKKHYGENFDGIVANEIDESGNTFSYWALENEDSEERTKIGDSRHFNYQATADMNITAVYAENADETVGAYIPQPIESIQKVGETLYNTLEIPVSFFNVLDKNSALKEGVSEFGVVIVRHQETPNVENIKTFLQNGSADGVTATKSVAYNNADKTTQLTNKGRYLATLHFTRVPEIDVYAYVIVDGTVYLSNMQTVSEKANPNQQPAPEVPEEAPAE